MDAVCADLHPESDRKELEARNGEVECAMAFATKSHRTSS